MNRHLFYPLVAAVSLAAAPSLTSCVDNDYDLTEDIDMTVQIGETWTFPVSSTDALWFKQILDLDPGSSIKAVGRDGEYGLKAGDYVLVQEADPQNATIKIDRVPIDNLKGDASESELAPFVVGTSETITVAANPTLNKIDISNDDVTDELVNLESVDLDMLLKFSIGFKAVNFNGTATIDKGYTASFDKSWTIELADAASKEYLEMVDNHTVRFKKAAPVQLSKPFVVALRLTRVDCTALPAGQGLYVPGRFRLETDVQSQGNVSIKASDVSGSTAILTLQTVTSVSAAEIVAVTGIVDPRITINPTAFSINDVPDFLNDNGNYLDMENPQIFFTVTNTAPVALEINGMLVSQYESGADVSVGVGSAYGTSPIVIAPSATTRYVVSRKPMEIEGVENVVVPDLASLLTTIPDDIAMRDISAKALPRQATIALGSAYSYKCDYEAVVPLAFGPNLNLEYSHDEKNWDEDLKKYSISKVLITAKVSNTVPMNMTPEVIALDRAGNAITDITATIEGSASAGTIDKPTASEIKITLESTAKNIGALDGVRIKFRGNTAPEYAGINLNERQSLKFTNIAVKILGGVVIDLND